MSVIEPQVDTPPQNKKVLRAVLLTLPMLLLIGMMVFSGSTPKSTPELIAKILTFSIFTAVFFMMMLTGKTYKYPGLPYLPSLRFVFALALFLT